MTTSEFKQLLDTAITGEEKEARAAGKELLKTLKWKNVENQAELAKEYWHAVEQYQTINQPYNLAELVTLLSVFGWGLRTRNGKLDEQHLNLATDMTITAMTHPNGVLRERARHAADYLRIARLGFPLVPVEAQLFEAYLERIEQLINQHRPSRHPRHIEGLKPSVFKTLVIHWHDLGQGLIGEQYAIDERAEQLQLPTYTYWDDDWLDENQPSAEEERATLWQKHSPRDAKRLVEALQYLEDGARARLTASLKQRGWDSTVAKDIDEQIQNNGTEGGLQAFFELAKQYVLERQDPKSLLELSAVVRGIQSLANHVIQQNQVQKPVTELLVGCALSKAEFGRHAPESWESFVYALLDAHASIEQFQERHTRAQELPPDLKIRLESTLSEDELSLYDTAEQNEALADIAHYAIDWYAMTEPWMLQKRSPQQLAAISWYVVAKANSDYLISRTELAEFGGWKGASSLHSAGDRVFSTVYSAMADPELLKL